MVAACNEWMRRFTENPQQFEAEHQTVLRFLAEQGSGTEPSYGEVAVAHLEMLSGELSA